MAIANYVLTSSPSNIHVSSGDTAVSTMYFCNLGGAASTVCLWALPNGDTVASGNTQVYNQILIASGDTFVVDMEKLVFANGDKLQANASGTVTATVSYVGI